MQYNQFTVVGMGREATATFKRDAMKTLPGLFNRLGQMAASGATGAELFKAFNAAAAARIRRSRAARSFRAILGRTPVTMIHSLRREPRSTGSEKGGDDSGGGGDGDDPDDSDLPPRQRSEVEYLRSLTGRKGGILEQTYRVSLHKGGDAR